MVPFSASLSISFTLLWVISSLVPSTLGQTNKLFQWGFENTQLSTQLGTCNPLSIIVKSFDPTTNSTQGTPPYYMISFALGETPVTTFIGTDENNLSWTPTQPVGSQLVLSVVDANGSAGGVTPRIMTIIPGSTTQCVTKPLSTPEFSVTTNVTTDLTTCQPWGFTIKGGVPPYTITLLSPNSPIVTNASVGLGDDHFTYINRADPDGTLVGAISDLTGRWAKGVASVNTKGSTDVSCTGLVSSSGNSTQIAQQDSDALAAADASKKRKAVATGVSVTLVLLLLAGLGVAAFFYIRKRKRIQEEEERSALPEQFVQTKPEPQILSINNYLISGPVNARGAEGEMGLSRAALKAREAFGNRQKQQPSPPEASSQGAPLVYQPSQAGSNLSETRSASFTNFPSTSIRGSAKALEAGVYRSRSRASDRPELRTVNEPDGSAFGEQQERVSSDMAFRPPGIVSRRPTGEVIATDERGVVVQHKDAGVVRELPPPYAARGGPGRSS